MADFFTDKGLTDDDRRTKHCSISASVPPLVRSAKNWSN